MAVDIVRAWKDAKYRESLTPEELASLPLSPAGYPELTAEQMEGVVGGVGGGALAVGSSTGDPIITCGKDICDWTACGKAGCNTLIKKK